MVDIYEEYIERKQNANILVDNNAIGSDKNMSVKESSNIFINIFQEKDLYMIKI